MSDETMFGADYRILVSGRNGKKGKDVAPKAPKPSLPLAGPRPKPKGRPRK